MGGAIRFLVKAHLISQRFHRSAFHSKNQFLLKLGEFRSVNASQIHFYDYLSSRGIPADGIVLISTGAGQPGPRPGPPWCISWSGLGWLRAQHRPRTGIHLKLRKWNTLEMNTNSSTQFYMNWTGLKKDIAFPTSPISVKLKSFQKQKFRTSSIWREVLYVTRTLTKNRLMLLEFFIFMLDQFMHECRFTHRLWKEPIEGTPLLLINHRQMCH